MAKARREVPGRWSREDMLVLLVRSPKFVERAILRMYQLQTREEQLEQRTKLENGVGWNGVDAPFMTSLADQIINNVGDREEGHRLSVKQREKAQKILRKYVGQMTLIANGEI